jgi:hypothetical protein
MSASVLQAPQKADPGTDMGTGNPAPFLLWKPASIGYDRASFQSSRGMIFVGNHSLWAVFKKAW